MIVIHSTLVEMVSGIIPRRLQRMSEAVSPSKMYQLAFRNLPWWLGDSRWWHKVRSWLLLTAEKYHQPNDDKNRPSAQKMLLIGSPAVAGFLKDFAAQCSTIPGRRSFPRGFRRHRSLPLRCILRCIPFNARPCTIGYRDLKLKNVKTLMLTRTICVC